MLNILSGTQASVFPTYALSDARFVTLRGRFAAPALYTRVTKVIRKTRSNWRIGLHHRLRRGAGCSNPLCRTGRSPVLPLSLSLSLCLCSSLPSAYDWQSLPSAHATTPAHLLSTDNISRDFHESGRVGLGHLVRLRPDDV